MYLENFEFFRYKPEFNNGKTDYAVLQGKTTRIVPDTFNTDKTFEFCARYKGALTYHKEDFYCCGGTSAYLFEAIIDKFPDDLEKAKFSPCFKRKANN